MGNVRPPVDPVADLQRRLARLATPKARQLWTRTLRGEAACRGVPMATVRRCTHAWWHEHGLAAHGPQTGKRIALSLIEQPMTEDKLAGVLLLQEHLGDALRASDLPAFARLFSAGHLADGNAVDWFGDKVLATMLARGGERAQVARALATWGDADTIWQRRAACVAFVEHAPRGDATVPGLVALALGVCARVVWSHERADQTAVGLLLRELSKAEPARVVAFIRRHARLMSKECARTAVAKLPPAQRRELLAHHARATTL